MKLLLVIALSISSSILALCIVFGCYSVVESVGSGRTFLFGYGMGKISSFSFVGSLLSGAMIGYLADVLDNS